MAFFYYCILIKEMPGTYLEFLFWGKKKVLLNIQEFEEVGIKLTILRADVWQN